LAFLSIFKLNLALYAIAVPSFAAVRVNLTVSKSPINISWLSLTWNSKEVSFNSAILWANDGEKCGPSE
jgi:hypothetical protein